MHTILIVEDEDAIAQSLEFVLQTEGFATNRVSLAKEAISTLKNGEISLVILDVGLPDISGFEACKEIRSFSDIPIIFLTARSDEIDRIVGLEIGGDDYVVKPFSPREVASRVKVILRRSAKIALDTAKAKPDGFNLDSESLAFSYGGTPVELTKTEFLIFRTLFLSPAQVFSRAQLLTAIDSPNCDIYTRTIDTHIKTLRAKLKAVGAPESSVSTVRGFGYKFEQ